MEASSRKFIGTVKNKAYKSMMIMQNGIILRTGRLTLRPFSVKDSRFILRLLNEPSFIRYIGDRGVRSLKDSQNYIEEKLLSSYNRCGFGLYRVELTKTSEPVGICGLVQRDYLPNADLGFAFLPEFCGKGYAFEAASASVQYAKADFALNRLLATTAQENKKSIQLLKKLGFEFDKMIRPPSEKKKIRLYAINI